MPPPRFLDHNVMLVGDILLKENTRSLLHRVISFGQQLSYRAAPGHNMVHAAIVVAVGARDRNEISEAQPNLLINLSEALYDGLATSLFKQETTTIQESDTHDGKTVTELTLTGPMQSDGSATIVPDQPSEKWELFRLSTDFDWMLEQCVGNELHAQEFSKLTKKIVAIANGLYVEIIDDANISKIIAEIRYTASKIQFLPFERILTNPTLLCAFIKAAAVFELRELSGNIASSLSGQYAEFRTDVRAGSYSYKQACCTVLATMLRGNHITNVQLQHLHDQIAGHEEFDSEFCCSTFVVYCYSVAAMIMHHDHVTQKFKCALVQPLTTLNITKTSPGELYVYLTREKGWLRKPLGALQTELVSTLDPRHCLEVLSSIYHKICDHHYDLSLSSGIKCGRYTLAEGAALVYDELRCIHGATAISSKQYNSVKAAIQEILGPRILPHAGWLHFFGHRSQSTIELYREIIGILQVNGLAAEPEHGDTNAHRLQ